MSSSAFGHFQLCAPHKINYSFLASGHSKLDAACQEQMIRWTDGDHHTEAVSLNLTCPGWCWRCWSCWPSWLVLSPSRSSGCSAAADPPVGETAGFRVAAWLLYSTQAWLLCPTGTFCLLSSLVMWRTHIPSLRELKAISVSRKNTKQITKCTLNSHNVHNEIPSSVVVTSWTVTRSYCKSATWG